MKEFFQAVDIFDKSSNDDFRISTATSALLSSLFSFFIVVLVVIQVSSVIKPTLVRDLNLQAQGLDSQELANVSIDIIVNMPCYFLHLDVLDSNGFDQLNINTTVKFMRLTADEKFIDYRNTSIEQKCYSCYGALPEGYCCNDCQQLLFLHLIKGLPIETSEWPQCNGNSNPGSVFKDEKCRIKGKISLNKAAGNFHIAPGFNVNGSYRHVHDVSEHIPDFDLSHKILNMRVGKRIPLTYNPLRQYTATQRVGQGIVYKYTLLVTPAVYKTKDKLIGSGYDYTAMINKYYTRSASSTGIYFFYSFTPYGVTVNAQFVTVGQMLTSTMGFLAGIFAILTLVDETFFKDKNINEAHKEKNETPKEK